MSIESHKSARCDCYPGVCNKLMTVYAARYQVTIRCSLSSTLSSVEHILQDVNRKAQNWPYKRKCQIITGGAGFNKFEAGTFFGRNIVRIA